VDAALRAKLRNLLAAIEELNPRTWRDGPHSILERYLELNGTVLDLLAVGTLEAKRSVVTIASFLRFTADWQLANPGRTLADFIEYLEAFKAAGGELPTSVELSEDVEGVRLMTLYQAKGLEFLVPARAPARAGPRRQPPPRRGAAPPVRRDHARPGAGAAHHPRRDGGEEGAQRVRRRAARWRGAGADEARPDAGGGRDGRGRGR
jgi:hypothetical protein